MTPSARRSILCLVLAALASLVLFRFLFVPFLPVWLGIVLALVLRTPSETLARLLPRPLAAAACALGLGVVLILAVRALSIRLARELAGFQPDVLFRALDDLGTAVTALVAQAPPPIREALLPNATFTPVREYLQTQLAALLKTAADTVSFTVGGTILALVVAYLVLAEWPALVGGYERALQPSSRRCIARAVALMRQTAGRLLAVQFALATLTTVISLGVFIWWGIGRPFALALLTGVADLLPLFGPGLVFVPWAGYLFANGNLVLGWKVTGLYVVFLVARRFMEPRLYGAAVGVSPLAALVSIIAGYAALGGLGLLAGPVALLLWRGLLEIIPLAAVEPELMQSVDE